MTPPPRQLARLARHLSKGAEVCAVVNDVERRVFEAFERLGVEEADEFKLQTAVQTIAILVGADTIPYRPLPAFQNIGRTRVEHEIKLVQQMAKRASRPVRKGQADPVRKLRRHMKTLHMPTIDALADVGVFRHDTVTDPVQTALRASMANISNLPDTVQGGRPSNLRAYGIAQVLAWHYEQVTGKRTGVSKGAFHESDYGPFVTLLDTILSIAGIRADPYVVAMAASKARKSR